MKLTIEGSFGADKVKMKVTLFAVDALKLT